MRLAIILSLLLAAVAGAGSLGDVVGWIGSLSGVSAKGGQEKNGRYEATYTVSNAESTLASVRAGLMRRGWMVDSGGSQAGPNYFLARKDNLRLDVTAASDSSLTVRVHQAGIPGQPQSIPASAAGGTPLPSGESPETAPAAPTRERTIEESHLSQDVPCQGGEIVVNGGYCVIRLIGECGSLVVKGSGNTISLTGRVGNIHVMGANNQIFWSGQANLNAPSVLDQGSANRIQRQ